MDVLFSNKFEKIISNGINNSIENYIDFIFNIFDIDLEIKYLTKDFYNLAIANHVCEFDFFILNKIFDKKYKFIADERLKILKYIPLMNLWLKYNELIFIKRDNSASINYIQNTVNANDNIFIFPEGTFIYKDTHDKRINTCLSKNIQPFNNVLLPKENGFNTIKNILKPEYITNITFKYILHDDKVVQNLDSHISMLNLLDIKQIKKIIVVIDKIKVDHNTNINEIFREKDKLIDQLH